MKNISKHKMIYILRIITKNNDDIFEYLKSSSTLINDVQMIANKNVTVVLTVIQKDQVVDNNLHIDILQTIIIHIRMKNFLKNDKILKKKTL